MSKTNYAGIDYAGPNSTTNRDPETGIRYGIISANEVGQSWYDAGVSNYGDPCCPACCGEVLESNGDKDYYCAKCRKALWSDECFGDEPVGIEYSGDGYAMNQDSSGDLWVFKSPFYTYAAYCSPCAPGACHLSSPFEPATPVPNTYMGWGEDYEALAESAGFSRVFALSHDWFEDGETPYPVFSVETGKLVVKEVV